MATNATSSTDKPDNLRPHGIVVGYDHSTEAVGALKWAMARAKATSSPLAIVVVIPAVFTTGIDGVGLTPDALMPTDEDMRKYPGIAEAIDELGADQVTPIGRVGVPAAELLELSADADLLVVGSRGRGAVAATVLGSTAYAVVGRAECPVVVVRGPEGSEPVLPGPGHPIVVAIEDAEISAEPMRLAAAAAARTGAPVRLVRATANADAGDWPTPFADVEASIQRELNEADIATLTHCAQVLADEHPDLTIEQVHAVGSPSRVVIRSAKDAALIVMGSRGRGGFKSLVLGSVSHSVIQHATCPVEVVRTARD